MNRTLTLILQDMDDDTRQVYRLERRISLQEFKQYTVPMFGDVMREIILEMDRQMDADIPKLRKP